MQELGLYDKILSHLDFGKEEDMIQGRFDILTHALSNLKPL